MEFEAFVEFEATVSSDPRRRVRLATPDGAVSPVFVDEEEPAEVALLREVKAEMRDRGGCIESER